jgi:8-oxo-dGTP pyrophosphatase MutT (NUDIX family)|tara:strand:+ start:3243 stop:4085 length:843 start_codon:yes stop_codon:yes gene_type:complete
MTDYDPAEVAIRPAATVMLVDDRPDLQVLMMQRHANTVFAGGMWVFPGGSVDADDDSQEYQAISVHRSDEEASQLMGLQSGGLAFYVAAIRESFEEAGILLAIHQGSDSQVDFSDQTTAARFESYRDEVNQGNRDFLEVVRGEGLLLDVAAMHYVAHWITPLGPPRRFSARFFVARMPDGQTPLHDNRETVHAEWLSPNTILERFDREEMVLMTPTLRMVKSLSLFASAHDVIAAAEANQTDHRARVLKASGEIVMPGEPGYEQGVENIESGWVRLRPLT